jgi:predicted nucleotidyltransferase
MHPNTVTASVGIGRLALADHTQNGHIHAQFGYVPTSMPRRQATKPIEVNSAAPIRLSPADALFSTTQQRVLALLFGHPERSFYASEIIARTRAGSGATQRELARLLHSELVTTLTSGRQKYYRANPDSPVFEELQSIVRKTCGLVEPLRVAIAAFDERVEAAFIFGSVAKNEDSSSSDVDLFIVGNDLSYGDLFEHLEKAEQQVGRKINPTIYTKAELRKKSSSGGSFIRRVLEQPKIWLKGDDDALSL